MSKDDLDRKRAEVLGKGKVSKSSKKKANFAVMGLTLVLVLVGAYLFLGRGPEGVGSTIGGPVASASAGEIERVYNPADFSDGKAKFFDYTTSDGIRMSYFLVRASDGQIHSALNACDSCWPEGKGYSQDGGEMICNNCKMRFKLEKVGLVKGGCNPSPLKTTLRDGKIVVACADIEAGKGLFNFKK